MELSELLLKFIGKPYLELVIISSGRVVQRLFLPDKGQDFVLSTKLDVAFIMPDRTEGLINGKKTIFFFDVKNIAPLTRNGYENPIMTMNENGKVITGDYEDIIGSLGAAEREVFSPCMVDTTLFKRLVETKVITDLLKPVTDIFDALKTPLILLIAVIGILGVVFLI